MLAKHYAPDCPVRLNIAQPLPGEALLAFGPDAPYAPVALNLSETGGAFLVDGAWPHAERVDGGDGFRIELELGMPGGGWLALAGGVVWIRPDGGGGEGIDRIGVHFTDLDDVTRSKLTVILAEE